MSQKKKPGLKVLDNIIVLVFFVCIYGHILYVQNIVQNTGGM